MTVLIDTSVVIPLSRLKGHLLLQRFRHEFANDDIYLTSITEMELLQGALDHADWDRLVKFLGQQDILQPAPAHWREAARTFFELRRVGQTVRSALDCLIAELAMQRGLQLIHNDRDFEKIA